MAAWRKMRQRKAKMIENRENRAASVRSATKIQIDGTSGRFAKISGLTKVHKRTVARKTIQTEMNRIDISLANLSTSLSMIFNRRRGIYCREKSFETISVFKASNMP